MCGFIKSLIYKLITDDYCIDYFQLYCSNDHFLK